MLVSAVIVSFILGVVVTLLLQYVFIRRRFLALPEIEIDKQPQREKFKLPKVRIEPPQNQQNNLCAQRRLRSAWADAQADLSLRWAHMAFCWFCHEVAQLGLIHSMFI